VQHQHLCLCSCARWSSCSIGICSTGICSIGIGISTSICIKHSTVQQQRLHAVHARVRAPGAAGRQPHASWLPPAWNVEAPARCAVHRVRPHQCSGTLPGWSAAGPALPHVQSPRRRGGGLAPPAAGSRAPNGAAAGRSASCRAAERSLVQLLGAAPPALAGCSRAGCKGAAPARHERPRAAPSSHPAPPSRLRYSAGAAAAASRPIHCNSSFTPWPIVRWTRVCQRRPGSPALTEAAPPASRHRARAKT
jgi:hypothetical protein